MGRAVWADPRSFATTKGVSVDFLSSRYLDVSVPSLTYLNKEADHRYGGRVTPFGNPRLSLLDS